MATASRWTPPEGSVEYASHCSTAEMPTEPSETDRYSGRSVSTPIAWAVEMTLSMPMASATWAYPVLDDIAVALWSVWVP